MKKNSIIFMAFALLAMMAQCKKDNNGQATPDNSENAVAITLSVGDNGSKVAVNTVTGDIDFESGDKIYVGSGGKYVGSLTHDGDNHFVGSITNPVEGEPLQFYFLGNMAPEETIVAGSTEEFSVVISDQTEHLPVISCAASNEDYSLATTDYTAHLLNKCALAKFSVTTPANAPICVTGFNNKVTVDFTTNTLTPSQDGEGVIMLPAGYGENVEKWAILLPQEAVEAGGEGSAYSLGGNYAGIRPALPEILESAYLGDGIAVAVVNEVFPQGAINNALFTVNDYGDQVYFSQGNLQYIGSAATPYWQFAEHQWDYLGTSTGQNSASENVDRDLFGWGTSGYNHNNACYQPWSISTNGAQYYAYDNSLYNLYNQTGQADWGYNAIANGGNQDGFGWRTLTNAERDYVFNSRTDASSKWGHGRVNGVNGMILLPDAWTLPEGLGFTSGNTDWANDYSTVQWAQMEANGAVFLPAAGYRNGASVHNVGSSGSYWSSSSLSSSNYEACGVYFTGSYFDTSHYDNKAVGLSVRLVRNAE